MYARKDKVLLGGKKPSTINIFTTHTIVHTCLDVFVLKDGHDITISDFNINQTIKYLQRHLIFLNDSDNDYIIDEIGGRDKIEYNIFVSVEDDK